MNTYTDKASILAAHALPDGDPGKLVLNVDVWVIGGQNYSIIDVIGNVVIRGSVESIGTPTTPASLASIERRIARVEPLAKAAHPLSVWRETPGIKHQYLFMARADVAIGLIADLDDDGYYQYDAGSSQPRLLVDPLDKDKGGAHFKFSESLGTPPYDPDVAHFYASDPDWGQRVRLGRQLYDFTPTGLTETEALLAAETAPTTLAVGASFNGWTRAVDS